MKRLLLVSTLFSALAGCSAHVPPWNFYDQCNQSQSFLAMAECGRTNISSYCDANRNCTPNDNAFVLYTDSLVKSVKNRELSEAEAQRKWIEFRMSQVQARQQQQMQYAPRPATCYNTGSFIQCF